MASAAFVVLWGFSTTFPARASALDPVALAEDLRQPEAPALLEAASAADSKLRFRAARAFGRIQKPAGIDPLLSLARDTVPAVRAEAVFGLGQLGWSAKFAAGREGDILAAVIPLLADPSSNVRIAATEAVGKIGLDQTPSAVAPLLRHADASIRAEALMALYRYRLVFRLRDSSVQVPEISQDVMDAMLALTRDPVERVRRNLAYFFMRVKDARGFDSVLALSSDPEQWTRYFAVTALGKTGDPRAIPAAVRAAADPEYTIRVAAVNALIALKGEAQLPSSLVRDPHWHVRVALAQAQAGLSGEDFSILNALRADSSPSVQSAALEALVARKPSEASALLLQALGDPLWQVRAAAASSATKLAATERESLLQLAAKDPDVRVRSSALEGLASVETVSAFNTIRAAVASAEPAEKGNAAMALAQRKESESAAVAWAAYQGIPEPRWAGIRLELLGPVLRMRSEQTTAWLRLALADSDAEIVARAYAELEARGVTGLGPLPVPPPTVTPYREMTFAKDPVVRIETSKGIVEIRCFSRAAPIHVANFVGAARSGAYDGSSWHRVVSDFVVQGGSPDGAGWGSPDYTVRAEINRLRYHRGMVGMPRSESFDSGSAELFITHVPTPHLDGQYTIFGQVIRGMDVVDQLEVGDGIIRVTIAEN